MYAVVVSGGKQYRVSEGATLVVDRVHADLGASVVLDEVLMVGGSKMVVGAPTVAGASVTATVVEHPRGKKTEHTRYLHRRRTRTQQNGRAYLSVLRIDAINA